MQKCVPILIRRTLRRYITSYKTINKRKAIVSWGSQDNNSGMLCSDLRWANKSLRNIFGETNETLDEATINDNGNTLISECEQNDLKIMNGFIQHKNMHKYPWIKKYRTYEYIGASCLSDRHLITAKVLYFPRKHEQ